MGKSVGSSIALLMKKRYNQFIEIKEKIRSFFAINQVFFELIIVLS